MAQKIQIILEDDVDGGTASETVTFAIDGVNYEIDLNNENAARLRDSLAPWVGHARKLPRQGGSGRRRRQAASSRTGAKAERDWLVANGYQVSSRGRIPAHLHEIYLASR